MRIRFVAGIGVAFMVIGLLASSCGTRTGLRVLETEGGIGGKGGTGGSTDGGTKACGDGACKNGETCTSCPQDCGLCQTCRNGQCDSGETCSSCFEDCGLCSTCGDKTCQT